MDQIITLLTNLFNLTKVASVTLPGLALAGALALFLWPSRPIDTVRIPAIIASVKRLPKEQKPCSDLPVLERGNASGDCDPEGSIRRKRKPACVLTTIYVNIFDDEQNFKTKEKWEGLLGPEGELALVNLFKSVDLQSTDPDHIDQQDLDGAVKKIHNLARGYGQHPWESKVLKQFILDRTKDRLEQCVELENAWQGQEQVDNDQLKTDIANLDKQRSDLQDAYISSLKTNDRIISENFRRKLSGILELSDEYRERSGANLVSINERTRRLDEIKAEQANVAAILAEPGSLRAVQGFDVYVQGLVNHVVGFILLAIALSLTLMAFDRTVLANTFEDLFPGW